MAHKLAQFLKHESDHNLFYMHNKQTLKENKFHSLLWTRVGKAVGVILEEEISISRGQVSVEQGQ